MLPETKYARTEAGDIAYQIVSDGPVDVIFCPEANANIEVMWEEPSIARFFERMATFSRLIVFNWRGSGISDPIPSAVEPTVEWWSDDLRAVLDAAGSTKSFVVAHGLAGPGAGMFAATQPERVAGLVLLDSTATFRRLDDYPHGPPMQIIEKIIRVTREEWGTGVTANLQAPSMAGNERFRQWCARFERLSAAPLQASRLIHWGSQLDFRSVMQSVQAPTLILCRKDNGWMRAANSRYLSERIPGSRLIEIPGPDHLFHIGDTERIIKEIREFITGAPEPVLSDRVLSTVLFTDIVESTQRAAALGDQQWRDTLDRHDALVRSHVSSLGGRLVKTTGDGALAIFDGPARAIRCARRLGDDAQRLGLALRAGLHTGEIELRAEDIGGIAVHLASRVMGQAGLGEVVVSSTVKDLVVGSGIEFADRGVHALKGVPGEWRLFTVKS